MATPTREQIEAELVKLPPEDHAAFLAEVERRIAEEPPEPSFLDKLRAGARAAFQTKLPAISPLDPLQPVRKAVLKKLGVPSVISGFSIDPLLGKTGEEVTELLPMAGATAGGAAGSLPGATGGAAAGEAARQGIRAAVGLPPGTGIVQKLTGMDPESPEAMLTGLVAESAVTPVIGAAARGAGNVAEWFNRSSLRSIINLLQPRTQRDKVEALKLAARVVHEGIAPSGSTRAAQLETAKKLTEEAGQDVSQELVRLRGSGVEVPTTDVLTALRAAVPKKLPAGEIPEADAALRRAAERVLRDTEKVVAGRDNVPLGVAVRERRRLDRILRSFHQSRRTRVPATQEFMKVAADNWRNAIHETHPSLGIKDTRFSELLNVTRLLRDAYEESIRVGGLGSSAAEGASAGAALAGRQSILFMNTAKASIGTGPWASMSSKGKRLFAKILQAGAPTAQAWLRLADKFDVPEASPDEEKIAKDLSNMLGFGGEKEPPTVEEFVSRYQSGATP
jgi:hypothetical protein